MTLLSYIFPKKIAVFNSDFNGPIIVKEAFGRKYIEVGGLTQSGKIVENLYTKGFKKLGLNKIQGVRKILVLGLGGGTVVKVLNKFFPEAQIVAIDIDPVIVEAGKKYLDLETAKNLRIIIGDVFGTSIKLGEDYDLIVVDLFTGYEINDNLSDTKFLKSLSSRLSKNGRLIFNRLYFRKYIFEADKFLDKMREISHDVEVAKIYCNILIQVKKSS